MDFKAIRDSHQALQEEVLRRKARHEAETDKPFSAWEAVLDIGYEWWQSQPKEARTGYEDMLAYMGDAFGEMAVLLIQMGKANQQIRNGGIEQYFDNGYASCKTRRRFAMVEYDNIELHEQLVELFNTHFASNGFFKNIHRLLVDIKGRLRDWLDDMIDIDKSGCERCRMHPPGLDAEDLDDRWYSDELDIGKNMVKVVEEMFRKGGGHE